MLLTASRTRLLHRGLRLEYLTLGWNVVEAAVATVAGIAAGSIALTGFGLDAVVEAASASILVWRLRSESSGRRTAHETERTAVRGVAIAFFVLATYVAVQAVLQLVARERPDESGWGIAIAAASLVVMPLLAWRKRAASRMLGSHALHADARQTVLCSLLSAVLLFGLLANAAGLWWADPAAGLVLAALAAREGHWLWTTEDPACC